MKEYVINEHSWICSNNKNFAHYVSPERFLFFLNNKFYLITYCSCLNFGDEYEFKVKLIKRIIKKSKIISRFEVNKGVDLRKDLRDFRIRNKPFKKFIQQVNYIYSNCTGKQYCITTIVDYLEQLCNESEIIKNFKKAREFLEKNEYNYLVDQLIDLFTANVTFLNANDIEIFTTIDHLINKINNEIKR